jgi:hypothetical protein
MAIMPLLRNFWVFIEPICSDRSKPWALAKQHRPEKPVESTHPGRWLDFQIPINIAKENA